MKPSVILCSFSRQRIVVAYTFKMTGQDSDMTKPAEQHQWLEKFIGDWEMSSTGIAAEGQPPVETSGTLTCEMLGGFWLMNKMDAKVSGRAFKGLQTIGYDVKSKKFIGTWVDSTAGFMWKYTGTVINDGRKLMLEADGPDMVAAEKTAKYRDAYEFKSDDELIITSSMLGPDGKWVTFMNGVAKRKPNAGPQNPMSNEQ